MTALIWVVLLDLAALPPPAPAAGPRIEARAETSRRVRVRGRGFEPGERIDLMVDRAEPHASIACRDERSATVKADRNGAFRTRITISSRDCDIRCASSADQYLIWASWACGLDCRQALKSDSFTCR